MLVASSVHTGFRSSTLRQSVALFLKVQVRKQCPQLIVPDASGHESAFLFMCDYRKYLRDMNEAQECPSSILTVGSQ